MEKKHQGKWLKMEISPCRREDDMLMFVDIAREVFKFWVSAERARHGHGTGTSRVRRRFFPKALRAGFSFRFRGPGVGPCPRCCRRPEVVIPRETYVNFLGRRSSGPILTA